MFNFNVTLQISGNVSLIIAQLAAYRWRFAAIHVAVYEIRSFIVITFVALFAFIQGAS